MKLKLKPGAIWSGMPKILLAMKLIAIILFIALTEVHARGYAQNITIHAKNTSVEKVLMLIEKQSNYHFIYDSKLDFLKTQKVTINADQVSVSTVLEQCLIDLPVSYTIIQQTIALKGNNDVLKTPKNLPPLVQVTGIVTDEKGESLPGVSVIEKGTTNGVVTNASGKYSLKVTGPNSTLVFSFIGFNKQERPVKGATTINVTLTQKASDLNEVVVVGYGTARKATLTGAVSAVTGKDILETPNENILNSMAGKVPGVRIAQNTAQPGQYNTTYDIRGFSASGGGAPSGSPLIIIDGVPSDNATLSRLDPNDIDNVSVLKDASAAVYGVLAGNGVILVTTKKGKSGTSRIDYNVRGTLQYMNRVPAEVDAIQWMTLLNESTMHNINNPVLTFPAAAFTPFANGTQQSTDWRAAALKNAAPQWSHNVSASGGTDKVTYFISGGYDSQDGFLRTNSLSDDKYNFRSNIEAKVSKRITLNMQLSGIFDSNHLPNNSTFGNVFADINRDAPVVPVYANNDPKYPYYTPALYGGNAVAETDPSLAGYQLNKTNIFHGGLGLTYDVPGIEGLKAKALYNYDYTAQDNKQYLATYSLYLPVTPATNPATYTTYSQNTPSYVRRTYATSSTAYLQFALDYNHTFAKVHNIEALALYEQTTSQGDGFIAYRQEVLNSDQLAAGSASNQQGYSNNAASYFTRKSYVGKLHYDYESKYLVDFSIRRDGESNFPPAKPWGIFPSVLAAYRLSEEPFIKNNQSLSFIDNLKIRGSYGVLGDDSGTKSYQFITGYDYPAPNSSAQYTPQGSVFDGNYINAVGFRGLANPNITWYTSKLSDIGFDAELWNGKLGVTFDWYNRLRSGLPGTVLQALPGSVGAPLPQQNINSDETRGEELVLTNHERIGKVGLSLSANASYARTRWITYVEARGGNDYADWNNNYWRNGRYNDVYFGYGYTGQFQSFQQIRSSTLNTGGGNRGSLPGDYIYQDWNNDGVINGADVHPIGVTQPQGGNATLPVVNYGLSIGLNYEGFDLNLQVQGATGRYVSYPIWYSYPLDHQGNAFSYFLDRWHPVDPTANPYDPNTKYVPGYFAYTGTNINQQSNGPNGIQNASYVRLKSFELGYTFPVKLLQKIGISKLRVFASGYDLWTITGMKFLDPEHPIENNGSDYPLNHTYSVGVNATF